MQIPTRNEVSVSFPWSNVKTSLSCTSHTCGTLDPLESFSNLNAQVTPQTSEIGGAGEGIRHLPRRFPRAPVWKPQSWGFKATEIPLLWTLVSRMATFTGLNEHHPILSQNCSWESSDVVGDIWVQIQLFHLPGDESELVSVLASVRFSFLIYETTSNLYPMELLEENTEKVPGRKLFPSFYYYIYWKGTETSSLFYPAFKNLCCVVFTCLEGWGENVSQSRMQKFEVFFVIKYICSLKYW